MELHESLEALRRSQGRELFHDADSFRGALDDYLDEETASTGDINLLVDAVRLGAFDSMSTMLDSGADSDRALAEAGARLARDRGSADVGGATWALSVLGYATGSVSDAQVRRYRTQHTSGAAPPPSGPPTALPPTGSPAAPPHVSPPTAAAPPATTGPVWPSSGPSPVSSSGGVPHSTGFAGAPAPAYPGYGHAAPRKKRRIWPIVVGAVAAVVLIGGGVVTAVVVSDGGGSDDPGGETTSEGPDLSFDGIEERYAALGENVTSGLDECTASEPGSGESEQVECVFADGTLVLTTYESEEELTSARKRQVNNLEGTIASNTDSGAYYRFDPTVANKDSSAPPVLYWDSLVGVQSALLRGNAGVAADKLDLAFQSASATVAPPDGPDAQPVQEFIDSFGIQNCQRIPTEVGGETEESKCTRSGRNTWVGRFAKTKDLRRYRKNAKSLAKADGNIVVDYWYHDRDSSGSQDEGEPEQGKIYGYIEEQDDKSYGVLFVDDIDCRCYLQIYDKGQGDPKKLYDLFFG